MNIITFANQKGGVGKTMTVGAVASILTQEGYKVLLIDLDAQRNLDMISGFFGEPSLEIKRNDNESLSVLHVLRGECTLKDAIIPTGIGDLVRASNKLYGWTGNKSLAGNEFLYLADGIQKLKDTLTIFTEDSEAIPHHSPRKLQELVGHLENIITKNGTFPLQHLLSDRTYDHKLLENALIPVKNQYDYVLIDTNPSLTLLTLNALYACQQVVIPTFPEASAIEAILELYETILTINNINPHRKLSIAGVLTTKYSPHRRKSKRHEVILEDVVEKGMQTYLFKTRIRDTEKASSYVEANLDVVRHDPTGNTTLDYHAFVKELKLRLANIEEGAYS